MEQQGTDIKETKRSGSGLPVVILIVAACVVAAVFIARYFHRESVPQVWTVTSYASVTDKQCTIYTIEDNKGHFVIIDGGFSEDAEDLLHRIIDHDRHVDAWIVTHAHPDHVGAFDNLMLSVPDEFSVDVIYMPEADKDIYLEKAKPWDDVQWFLMMEEAIEGLDNVVYLHENDEVDLIGLKMKVLSAWDENVESLPRQLPNDGSLMFRLEGAEDVMLFCSDVEDVMTQWIVPAHKEELRADYLQVAHHGNDGLAKEFYDYVKPKVAFMDAPEWLLDPESKYGAHDMREYMKAMGAEVLTFETAPNSIELR